MHYPDNSERTGTRLPASSPWHEEVAHHSGRFQFFDVLDGVRHAIAVEPAKGYPLLVGISIPEDVILKDWRSRTALMIFSVGLLLVLASLLLRVMALQYRKLIRSQDELIEKTRAIEQSNARLLESEAELVTQNQRFDAAVNNMTQGLAMFDAESRLVVCNERFRTMYGFSAANACAGRTLRDIIMSEGFQAPLGGADALMADIMAMAARPHSSTHEFVHPSGRIFLATVSPMENGGWVATHEDVTEIRQSESRIRRLAHNDLLTAIPNRSCFIDKLEEARRRLEADGRPFSVLMLDLDRFKDVNDSLGHAMGDVLLKETAQRLLASLRSSDVVARLGGDEFAIIQGPVRTSGNEPDNRR